MGAPSYDAVVVGSGPNGLAAGLTIAETGRSVLVVEAKDTIGGGCRSAELTLPGFTHDVCSAVHPLALASPFFRSLRLEERGLRWRHPDAPLAHPLDDGSAVMLERSLDATAGGLGEDGRAYRRLIAPLIAHSEGLAADFLGPLRMPRHPLSFTRFGVSAVRSVRGLVNARFDGERAKALIAGTAAHSMLPLATSPTAGFGLFIAHLGHSVGWPVAHGGSQAIADAMGAALRSAGGAIQTGTRVGSLNELPRARAYLLDVSPHQVLEIAGDKLGARYRSRLSRYRYNPGVFKLDLALDGPIPWRAEEVGRAGTVHLGGTMEEIAASEAETVAGKVAERPYVLLAQASLFDEARAPEGKHTAWAYCHVPHASDVDMTDAIESQIERFAPGFRDLVIGRHSLDAAGLERYNENYVGGDINGGAQDLRQLFTRPTLGFPPYKTSAPDVLICSASTPPGGGVHGMCGYYAARTALRGPLK